MEKFTEIQKAASIPDSSPEAFTSISSVQGRGHGLEENQKLQGHRNDTANVDSPPSAVVAGPKASTKEEKEQRAFIPQALFDENKKILVDRVESSKKWTRPTSSNGDALEDDYGREGIAKPSLGWKKPQWVPIDNF